MVYLLMVLLKCVFFLAPLHGFEGWMTSILLIEWLSISCAVSLKMGYVVENELQNGLTSCPSKSGKRNWTDCKLTRIETILCGKNDFIQRILVNYSFISFLGHYTVVAITCIFWNLLHSYELSLSDTHFIS